MNDGIINSQDPFRKRRKAGEPLVYVPNGAGLNVSNQELNPPKTEYGIRQMFFNHDAVKNVVRGDYGRISRVNSTS